jgi:hypothetical protein
MSRFDSYATKYACLHMRRENGILEMRFHTDKRTERRLSAKQREGRTFDELGHFATGIRQ